MATKRYRRDFKELELRRRKGMRMLARGVAQAEVARALEVSRQTTSSWAKKLAEDPQAWRRKPLGRPGGLDAAQKKQLGKASAGGRGGQRLPDRAVDVGAGGQVDRARVWAGVQHGQCLAHSARAGVLQPTSGRSCHPARRSGDQAMAHQALAGAKKKCRREGRTIVFIDESGLSERPTGSRLGRPKARRRCCNTASTGSSCRSSPASVSGTSISASMPARSAARSSSISCKR